MQGMSEANRSWNDRNEDFVHFVKGGLKSEGDL
jgi:hypothetical protein